MREYIDIVETAEPTLRRLTPSEGKAIKEVAVRVAPKFDRVKKLEVGVKMDKENESMNLLLLNQDHLDTADIWPFDILKTKGFPLTAEGNALLDIFIMGREELLSNVYACFKNNQLVLVTDEYWAAMRAVQ